MTTTTTTTTGNTSNQVSSLDELNYLQRALTVRTQTGCLLLFKVQVQCCSLFCLWFCCSLYPGDQVRSTREQVLCFSPHTAAENNNNNNNTQRALNS